MRTKFLPFSAPLIGNGEIAEVAATLRSGWLTAGPKVDCFEREFMAAVEAPAALAVNSCTSALHLALKIFDIGAGDAVITTPMTFCCAANVIEHVGAVPVLVDVQPGSLQIDPELIREKLESCEGTGTRIKALMPTHLYGHPCDLDAIIEIAREHGLAVVEDAAHALPARYKGRVIGSNRGLMPGRILSCFSFYPSKNVTTAEGGMLTGDRDLIEEARIWSSHGMSRDAFRRAEAEEPWRYDVVRPGFKYNMTDMQAALGLRQLARLPVFHARRKKIAGRYTRAFCQLEALEVPVVEPEADCAWHLYVIRLNLDKLRIDRSVFIKELARRNIGSSVHFIPIHLHEFYKLKYGYQPGDFPVAYREFQRIISLPLYPKMSDQDVEDVIAAVCAIVEQYRQC